ncbi:MAG: hypothetical protein K0Q59_420 [Paenibacillus sp.]|jgi:transcriptional pleiotropic regulator of transition state genes|nr:hypothetical protein [Paenibacillus sp.]
MLANSLLIKIAVENGNRLFLRIAGGVSMRPAGVVRRVDQLGRIVLPKSLRKRYRMNEGDPIEILVAGDQILLERYRPKCVICGEMNGITAYKDKHVCTNCMREMSELSL